MSLREYIRKRNFKQTTEPVGKKVSGRAEASQAKFVIQKHAASHLHYDFRLELEGVLKSWAVPKGFPLRHGDRRLAVQVEDHPLDYAGFEGTIPAGNYGGGTVMIWDYGTYAVTGGEPLKALKAGKLNFHLAGKKLKGDWTLVRLRQDANSSKPNWLLLKSGDNLPPLTASKEYRSALSGKSMEQIASLPHREWQSNRDKGSEKDKSQAELKSPRKINLKKSSFAKPKFVEPMKCRLAKNLPSGPEWRFEIKFDGVRAIALKEADSISLISRNEKDLTRKYPEVVAALQGLACREAVLDGEIVALDKKGKSSFQLLQSRDLPNNKPAPIVYYVFDLLNLNGEDLKPLPLEARQEKLQALIADLPDAVRFSGNIEASSQTVFNAMKARGLEGLVAKRRGSKYEPGQRSGAWTKFKWSQEQEFVVGGYTAPKGSREFLGALLVGYYQAGKLMFASKVGTGFDRQLLKSLHEKFKPLLRSGCPFVNLPEKRVAGAREGMTARQMKSCAWLQPKLVCQIKFAEWTRDQHLRQPVFLGLREDKSAKEVVCERAD